MEPTLQSLLNEWQKSQQQGQWNLLDQAAWWEGLLRGFPSRFQQACQASVRTGGWDATGWEAALETFRLLDDDTHPWAQPRRDSLRQMLTLHLQAVNWLLTYGRWTTPALPPEAREALQQLAQHTGVSFAFLADLVRFLTEGDVHPADQRIDLPVLLVNVRREQGVSATLRLERVPDLEEALFPHPKMAFLYWDEECQQGMENAWAWARVSVRWPERAGARWSLEFWEDPPQILRGPSMGAAFAAGLWTLAQLPAERSGSGGDPLRRSGAEGA